MADILRMGRLPILFRVKQGERDINNRPVKNDHLKVYRNVRNANGYEIDDDIMSKLKEYSEFNQEGKAAIIPISLLFDDPALNVRTHLACYKGNNVKPSQKDHTPFVRCKGNGVTAMRLMQNGEMIQIPCPGPDKCPGMTYSSNKGAIVKLCKLQGVFDFMLRGLTTHSGGVARYRTAGFNSASFILGQLQYLKSSLGLLRGLPLNIELTQTTTQATNNDLFTFYSLMISVLGDDPIAALADAKVKEMELREKSGFNISNLESAFSWMKGDIEAEENEDESDSIYDGSDGDSQAFEDANATSTKEVTMADKQKEKMTSGINLRAKAQEVLIQNLPAEQPPQETQTQELSKSQVRRIAIQKEAKAAKSAAKASQPEVQQPLAPDPGPEDFFPDLSDEEMPQ